ncbi:HDOD domain-containing protein [Paludibacterium purpuratum]|uniref:HD-like signal output (HDOD) protein n=1 Tax=Paludibacterium purpuratum TaxID=1144873 RepID=A0A4R7B8B9_9NEIS|nr:HDOD domain-containing protein [Paludibacterium purpuratum]TDR79976.1 HD-like signal output (HDOD) protein [Paludibacterium purpuratum]
MPDEKVLISPDARDKLLKNLVIPPRPAVLDSLIKLRDDSNVNWQQISQVIESDVSLSAALLKAANSPLISRSRTISSVSQAINILGSKNVVNLISGLVLRSRLTGEAPPSIEQFWERAMLIAQISKALCHHILHTPEDCQSYALFHGCGIALMLMRYKKFGHTLQLIEMAPDGRIPKIEQEQHGTSHDTVGYLVARAWNMPEQFCCAILLQFDPMVYDLQIEQPISSETRQSMAVTRAATYVWRTLTPGNIDAGWNEIKADILRTIGLDENEFEDWTDHMHHQLEV